MLFDECVFPPRCLRVLVTGVKVMVIALAYEGPHKHRSVCVCGTCCKSLRNVRNDKNDLEGHKAVEKKTDKYKPD